MCLMDGEFNVLEFCIIKHLLYIMINPYFATKQELTAKCLSIYEVACGGGAFSLHAPPTSFNHSKAYIIYSVNSK